MAHEVIRRAEEMERAEHRPHPEAHIHEIHQALRGLAEQVEAMRRELDELRRHADRPRP